ncbi:hypothetical protein WA026_004961 [Henosepilachna vigintioctopunctata]|uniref:Androgen-dependent TFPI-regulating protein n=1 Tax=Henosepilachna vigintioctopunctata TaxID=420089 RepID=A0AAW1UVM0_9CUCU
MVENKLRLGYHSLVSVCYIIGASWALFFCDFTSATDERVLDMQRYGGRYLTTWNFIFHILYFGVALNGDFLLMNSSCTSCISTVSKIKGYLFTCFLVPCSTYVVTVFWSLFNYDRDLVYPLATDAVVPLWFNHLVHSMTFVFMILEFYFTDINTIPSLESVLLGFSCLNVAYYSILFYTKSKTGRYFYGIFHLLSTWQLILFILGTFISCLFIIKGGMLLQQTIHDKKHQKINKLDLNQHKKVNGNEKWIL